MSQDKEREAFEAWAKTRGYNTRLSEYGHYPSLLTTLTHESWQARAALASQKAVKGDPVAWFRYENGMRIYYETKAWDDLQPLFASPPSREVEPLTEAELRRVLDGTNHMVSHVMRGPYWPELEEACRAVERAHGIHSREGGSK